jgi:hypothetical protein
MKNENKPMPDQDESYFRKYLLHSLAVLTFGLAAYFVGAGRPDYVPSIGSICLGYLYAGIVTFPVLLLLGRGKEIERCLGGCIALALIPEILVVVVAGVVLLVLAGVLFAIAFGFFAIFDAVFKTKSLDGFRGIGTKIKSWFSKTFRRKEAAPKQTRVDEITREIVENKWP